MATHPALSPTSMTCSMRHAEDPHDPPPLPTTTLRHVSAKSHTGMPSHPNHHAFLALSLTGHVNTDRRHISYDSMSYLLLYAAHPQLEFH
jgi:hypothetical protein